MMDLEELLKPGSIAKKSAFHTGNPQLFKLGIVGRHAQMPKAAMIGWEND